MAVKKIDTSNWEVWGKVQVNGALKTYRKRGFSKKQDALAWELAKKRELKEGIVSKFKDFKEAYYFYISQKKNITESTKVNNKYWFSDVSNTLDNDLSFKNVYEITKKDKFLKYKKGTQKTLLNFINKVFNFLNKHHDTNFKKINYEFKKEPKKINFLEPHILKEILKNNDELMFLYQCGLRISEFLGLKWKDYNLIDKTLKIERQYNRRIKALSQPKSINSTRILKLSNHCIGILDKRLSEFKKLKDFSPEWFIFGTDKPNYHHRYTIALNKLNKQYNTTITLHGLRHSCASLLINYGCSPSEVAYYLGDKVETVLPTELVRFIEDNL